MKTPIFNAPGLLTQMQNVKNTMNYDKFTMKDLEGFIAQIPKGNTSYKRPPVLMGDFNYRYMNATIANDEKELKSLNTEFRASKLKAILELQLVTGLPYDICYMLNKEFKHTSYNRTWDINYINLDEDEYDYHYITTELVFKNDIFNLITTEYTDPFTWTINEDITIKPEDLFNKIIINYGL